MSFLALIALAFAMSTDAFAAAIGIGTSLEKRRFLTALRLGLTFGIIEALTPLIGWLIGTAGAGYVAEWDHWIAFILLGGIGLHLLYEAFQGPDADAKKSPNRSLFQIILIAIGTSIDAMAVGVSLAFTDVNIWLAAALIGLATTTMVTIGVLLGQTLGSLFGRAAEIFGGLILISLGIVILLAEL